MTGPTVLLLASIPALRVAFDCIDRIEAFCKSVPRETFSCQNSSEDDPRGNFSGNPSGLELHSLQTKAPQQSRGVIVDVLNVTLTPSPTADRLLVDTTITLPKVPLTVITGPVGCGKTTLWKGILGEVSPDTGTIERSSNQIAYCSQTPWIPNLCIRDIICGPSPYDAQTRTPPWPNLLIARPYAVPLHNHQLQRRQHAHRGLPVLRPHWRRKQPTRLSLSAQDVLR